MRTAAGKIVRLIGVTVLLLAFLQIVMAFFPARASMTSLMNDIKAGRTHEITYYEENDTITVQWHTEFQRKGFTQEVTTLPKEAYEAAYVQHLRAAANATGQQVGVREDDPSVGWGGIAVLFAPVYASLVTPIAFRVLVAIVCFAVFLRISISRDSPTGKLLWSLICAFTGVGFLVHLVVKPEYLWVRRGSGASSENVQRYNPLIMTVACSVLLAIIATVLVSTNLV